MKQNQITPLELALELKRLADEVVRDVEFETQLPCLSHLTAIRPLVQLLSEVLAPQHVGSGSDEVESAKNPIGFGRN